MFCFEFYRSHHLFGAAVFFVLICCMQNYYELTIGVSSVTKKIKIVTNEMDCNNFELFDSQYNRRINRELFGKGVSKPFKILNIKLLKQNLGL